MNNIQDIFYKQAENNIPKRFRNTDYDRDVPEAVKVALRKISTGEAQGLYIHGEAGVGKTHIAYAIYKKIWRQGHKCQFYNVAQLLMDMRSDYDKDCSRDYCISKKIIEAENTVIFDDIGAEKMSDWVREMFYLIINNRYNNMSVTIFTSNLSLSELAEHYGDRIVSRIAGMCEVVKIEGEDRRIKKK